MKLYLTKEIALTLEGGDFDPSSIEADIRDVKQDIIDNANLDAISMEKVQALESHKSQTDSDIAMLKAKPDNVFDATEVMADIEELKARPIAPDAVNIQPLEDKIQALENRVMPDIAPLEDAIAELESRVDNDTLYDDTELKTRLTIVENRADNDTIFDDTELKNRLIVVENRVDNDTVFDDTELKDRLTVLENKPDNDTIFDDSILKLSHNSLVEHVRANTVQIYQDETEFLNAGSSFGFIRDNYFNRRAMVERINDRAYDAMANSLIGMSVGINAKAKLQLTYKEDSKPDELKSFVPICRSNVVGTTLIPDDIDVFWAEWYSDSNNESNYVIYRQDGVLVLAQWVGNKASSITELFDKLTAGGDISSDISVVHKLNETLENEYVVSYNDDDKYSLLKSGRYLYKVQGVEFSLDITYTGMANSNLDSEVTGYIEPDPVDILKDGNFYLKASFAYLGESSETEYLEPMGHYYLSQTSSTRLDIVSTRNSTSNPVSDALKNTISWQKRGTLATVENDTMIFPYFIPSTQKCYMVAIKGLQTSDIYSALDKGFFNKYDASDRQLFEDANILILFEIPLSGTMDETTLKISYMTQDRKNRVPVSYLDSVIANEFKKDYHNKNKGDTYSVRFTYKNLPSSMVAPETNNAIWM